MSPAAFAQQTAASWEAIKQAQGKSIAVVHNNGHSEIGQLEQISLVSLSLIQHGGRIVVISHDDVRKVYLRGSRSRKGGALAGLVIGAGSGAAVGAIGTQPCDACIISFSRGEGAAIGATLGAAVGTIVGVLVGGPHKKVLLYDKGVVSHRENSSFLTPTADSPTSD